MRMFCGLQYSFQTKVCLQRAFFKKEYGFGCAFQKKKKRILANGVCFKLKGSLKGVCEK